MDTWESGLDHPALPLRYALMVMASGARQPRWGRDAAAGEWRSGARRTAGVGWGLGWTWWARPEKGTGPRPEATTLSQ